MGELQGFGAVLAAGAGDQAHGRAGEALNHAPHRRWILCVADHLLQSNATAGVAAAFAVLHQIEKQASGNTLIFGGEAGLDAVGLPRQGAAHPADGPERLRRGLAFQQPLPDA